MPEAPPVMRAVEPSLKMAVMVDIDLSLEGLSWKSIVLSV